MAVTQAIVAVLGETNKQFHIVKKLFNTFFFYKAAVVIFSNLIKINDLKNYC